MLKISVTMVNILIFLLSVHRGGGLPDRDLPDRDHLDRGDPLDREDPQTETTWTEETPLDREDPQTETPWTEKTPWTETTLGQRPPPLQWRPPCTVQSGWYACYWNAFLSLHFFICCKLGGK